MKDHWYQCPTHGERHFLKAFALCPLVGDGECLAPDTEIYCGGSDLCPNCSVDHTWHGDCGLSPEQVAAAKPCGLPLRAIPCPEHLVGLFGQSVIP